MHTRLCVSPIVGLLVLGACASNGRLSGASLSERFALDSLAIVTAIERGPHTAHPASDVRLICVNLAGADPSPELLAAVQVGRTVTLRPGSACHVDTTGGPLTGRSLVAERVGGLRGIAVSASRPTIAAANTVSFRVSYYQHYLSGADWFCTAKRRDRQWVIDTCRLDRIS